MTMKVSVQGMIAASTVLALVSTASAQRRPLQDPHRQPSPAEQQAIEQGMGALFKALQGGQQQGGPAGLIEHRQLKSLLPAELTGFKRTLASSERSGAMGMSVSKAEARYEGAKDATLEIEITDLGGLGGFGAMAQAGWMMADVDRETDNGFERTAAYKGLKAHEEYDTSDQRGKMEVMVGGRILVSVRGSNVKFEVIRATMDQIDLAKLAALKPADPAK